MSSIEYSDIENMTNEEAAAYFGPMTDTPILCGDLENLLNWGGYASRNSVTGAWQGVLIDFMTDAPAGGELLAEGLDELFTHLNQPRSTTVDTTEQPWAGKMELLLNGLVAAGIVDIILLNDVVKLGGGQPNIGTDYQGIRDQHDNWQAEAIENDRIMSEVAKALPVYEVVSEALNTSLTDVLESRSSSTQEYIDAARASIAEIESAIQEDPSDPS